MRSNNALVLVNENPKGQGRPGKKWVQTASRRRFITSSDGEFTTFCGSLFHGEAARTANEFAQANRNAMGFRKVSEYPLRTPGDRRVKSVASSTLTFLFKVSSQAMSRYEDEAQDDQSHFVRKQPKQRNQLSGCLATSQFTRSNLRYKLPGNA